MSRRIWSGGAGLLLTAGILAQAMPGLLGAGMLLCGLGQGLFQVGYMDTTTTLLPAHERGVAGSLIMLDVRADPIRLKASYFTESPWRRSAMAA